MNIIEIDNGLINLDNIIYIEFIEDSDTLAENLVVFMDKYKQVYEFDKDLKSFEKINKMISINYSKIFLKTSISNTLYININHVTSLYCNNLQQERDENKNYILKLTDSVSFELNIDEFNDIKNKILEKSYNNKY